MSAPKKRKVALTTIGGVENIGEIRRQIQRQKSKTRNFPDFDYEELLIQYWRLSEFSDFVLKDPVPSQEDLKKWHVIRVKNPGSVEKLGFLKDLLQEWKEAENTAKVKTGIFQFNSKSPNDYESKIAEVRTATDIILLLKLLLKVSFFL